MLASCSSKIKLFSILIIILATGDNSWFLLAGNVFRLGRANQDPTIVNTPELLNRGHITSLACYLQFTGMVVQFTAELHTCKDGVGKNCGRGLLDAAETVR